MSESYFSNSEGRTWHTHDIYEGAGGNVRHAHGAGAEAHSHDWSGAIPVMESRDGFFIEAARLRKEQSETSAATVQPDNPEALV